MAMTATVNTSWTIVLNPPERDLFSSGIDIHGIKSVFDDEIAAGFDNVTHEGGENLFSDIRLIDLYLHQRTYGWIERGFPELLRIHFAQAFVALDGKAMTALLHNSIDQRAGTRNGKCLVLDHQ